MTGSRPVWPPDGPALVGVGVGPGDPSLVTLRAVDVLRSADVVIAPSTARDPVGRAEAVARELVPSATYQRVTFVMEVDTEARRGAMAEVVTQVVAHLDVGRRVAFVTLGDPNVYSTFSSVAEGVVACRADAVVSTVPGIMAFQELAARSATVVVDGEERLVLIPAHREVGDITATALADPDTAVVVYKGGRRVADLAAGAEAEGRLEGAVLGELMGMAGERVAPLADVVADGPPLTYLSTVIVPPRRQRPALAGAPGAASVLPIVGNAESSVSPEEPSASVADGSGRP